VKRMVFVIAMLVGARAQAEPDARPHLELPSQSLTDGNKLPFTPMTIPDSPGARDSRPVMIGGGIVVLAMIFWWNRKRRDQFDRSDAPRDAVGDAPTGDDDTDDLQAAARGDDKDEA
jgi:hypothetical protein